MPRTLHDYFLRILSENMQLYSALVVLRMSRRSAPLSSYSLIEICLSASMCFYSNIFSASTKVFFFMRGGNPLWFLAPSLYVVFYLALFSSLLSNAGLALASKVGLYFFLLSGEIAKSFGLGDFTLNYDLSYGFSSDIFGSKLIRPREIPNSAAILASESLSLSLMAYPAPLAS